MITIATNQYLESPSPPQVLVLLFTALALHDLHEIVAPQHIGPPGHRRPALA
jgi:hypothetical protein